MDEIYVGAIDCSFNFCGCALLRKDKKGEPYIEATRIIKNLKTDKKGSLVDIQRAESLYIGVKSFVDSVIKTSGTAKIIAYEVPGGSQSQRAAACLGMAKGVIASVLGQFMFEPMVGWLWLRAPIMPSEVHKKVMGKVKATKEDIMQYVLDKYPRQVKFINKRYVVHHRLPNDAGVIERYTKGEFEHIADAIVLAEIGLGKLKEEK